MGLRPQQGHLQPLYLTSGQEEILPQEQNLVQPFRGQLVPLGGQDEAGSAEEALHCSAGGRGGEVPGEEEVEGEKGGK